VKVRHSTTSEDEKRTDRELARQWESIDWEKARVPVNRLQTRIAKATRKGNWNLVKRLQYLLTHSYSAKILAIRKVTQNRGKRTPGIDGETWYTASEKMRAATRLTDSQYHSQPLRRIYIPKPGKDTKRPISIPTMHDRAMQALYALALQPVAETTADTRSFGFRPFRGARDAADYAFKCLRGKNAAPWILEGDIKGCFDNIAHDWLMANIPLDKSILAQFLNAGFIFNETLFPTETGTPQGGIVSPILANMALDGIEKILSDKFPEKKVYFIRYADDFLVTAPTKELAEEAREIIRKFLKERGLELSEDKTMITHIDKGFDFLGWQFRKYAGVLLIKPSRSSIESICRKVYGIIHTGRSWTQDRLIQTLNPVITGWTQYHRHIVAKETFRKMDFYLWLTLWQWAKRRHHGKGHKWIVNRYWHTEENRNWVFRTKTCTLTQFADTKICRHCMPKLDANPFLDRNYFLERKERTKQHTSDIQSNLSFFSFCRPKNGL
jgi:RNA-directed DNA polymerase